MDENENSRDLEFKRYLKILRPYIGHLIESDVIDICNAWIKKLSECNEKELKKVRNKYVFSLCYQLARGTLEDPFLKYPPEGILPSLCESETSDESSTEIECYVVDADDTRTEILFENQKDLLTDTELLSQSHECKYNKSESLDDTDMKSNRTIQKHNEKHTLMCFNCPEILNDYIYYDSNEIYEHRANNLIQKLRDIKTQNVMLQNELTILKEETISKHNSFTDENKMKVDHATSALLQSHESTSTLKSLKSKLQEVQDSRNSLIEKVSCLQDIINNFDDIKKHEIDEIVAKHKLEIINLKTEIKLEGKNSYEKKIEVIKQDYESKIESLKNKSDDHIKFLTTSKNDEIEDKNKIINKRDDEIAKLNSQIEDLKSHLHTVLEKFIEKPSVSHNKDDNIKSKAEQLERRLNKMEKSKSKLAKMYETKVANLQREKHLTECSLQLQIVRQRAQVVNEVKDENQTELATALDKLETKYKEIVANVQSTAIQRRMQDQMALESILQAACGIPSDNNSPGTNGQFSKTMRNQNLSNDGGISSLSRGHKVGNICMGNKSFGDDSVVTGYCLNGERMGELFEKIYIPQRDNATDNMK